MSTLTVILAEGLKRLGYGIGSEHFFDTVRVVGQDSGARTAEILEASQKRDINYVLWMQVLSVTLDETGQLARPLADFYGADDHLLYCRRVGCQFLPYLIRRGTEFPIFPSSSALLLPCPNQQLSHPSCL